MAMPIRRLRASAGSYDLWDDPFQGGFVIRNGRTKRAWGAYFDYEYAREKMRKLAHSESKRQITKGKKSQIVFLGHGKWKFRTKKGAIWGK